MFEKVRASHILVKTEKEARAVLTDLKSGSSFEKLAQIKSICPSGRRGGDLGFFTRGMMVGGFEAAAFSLNTNEISEPVNTEFGWHIIKVVDKK